MATAFRDKTTVFADGLMIPTGLEIAPTPDLGSKKEDLGSGAAPDDPTLPKSNFLNPKSSPLRLLRGRGDEAAAFDRHRRRRQMRQARGRPARLRHGRQSPKHQLLPLVARRRAVFSQGLHAHSRVETPHGIVALDQAGLLPLPPARAAGSMPFTAARPSRRTRGALSSPTGARCSWCAGNNGGIYWPLPEMIRGVQNGRREQIWEKARGRKSQRAGHHRHRAPAAGMAGRAAHRRLHQQRRLGARRSQRRRRGFRRCDRPGARRCVTSTHAAASAPWT